MTAKIIQTELDKQTDANLWVRTRDELFNDNDGFPYERSKKLAKLLGIEYSEVNYVYKMEFTPELRSRLKALTGPYGEVILKMMEVRKHGQR